MGEAFAQKNIYGTNVKSLFFAKIDSFKSQAEFARLKEYIAKALDDPKADMTPSVMIAGVLKNMFTAEEIEKFEQVFEENIAKVSKDFQLLYLRAFNECVSEREAKKYSLRTETEMVADNPITEGTQDELAVKKRKKDYSKLKTFTDLSQPREDNGKSDEKEDKDDKQKDKGDDQEGGK